MAGEPVITVVGNLTSDPELRFTQSNVPVANFTIADTPRQYDKTQQQYVDGETLFIRCNAWRKLAENVAESFVKGQRVLATGRLSARSFQDREGNDRTSWELTVDDIGPSVFFEPVTGGDSGMMNPNPWAQQSQQPQQQGGWGQPWQQPQQQTQQQPQQPQQQPQQGDASASQFNNMMQQQQQQQPQQGGLWAGQQQQGQGDAPPPF